MEYRRRTDTCIAKRLYEICTPYVQIAGFAPVLGGIITTIWLLFGFISNTEAYGPAISDLQHTVNQQHDSLIQMQQEVHDIHEWLKARRR